MKYLKRFKENLNTNLFSPEPQTKDPNIEKGFIKAVSDNDISLVKRFIDEGVNPNYYYCKAIRIAIKENYDEIFNLLANFVLDSSYNKVIIFWCAEKGKLNYLKKLRELGFFDLLDEETFVKLNKWVRISHNKVSPVGRVTKELSDEVLEYINSIEK